MTSSQPVVTPNAINFTPDNKHAYAYSGNKAIINAEQTMIEGQTNSEYIRAKISISNFSGSGDDIRYYVYFNDVQVYGGYYNSTSNNDGGRVSIMDKSIVINANESITQTTGKTTEQWILRIIVLYLLGQEHLIGVI
jgi:hypothetical protein